MGSGEAQHCIERQRKSLSALHHQTFLTRLLLQTLSLSYADAASTLARSGLKGEEMFSSLPA